MIGERRISDELDIARMENEGPAGAEYVPTKSDREKRTAILDGAGPTRIVKAKGSLAVGTNLEAFDIEAISRMGSEGPTGAQVGKGVLTGAISFAKVSASIVAELNGPRIPGAQGNGKA